MAVTANNVLDLARSQIGTKATSVKQCKYNTWFYGSPVSGPAYNWCAVFVCWVFSHAEALDLIFGMNANCGVMASAFQSRSQLVYHKDYSLLQAEELRAGDVVFFHWSNNRSVYCPGVYTCDHVGVVESVNVDGTITSIEGNTGGSSNGEVMRRVRSMSVVSCAGRPAYAPSSAEAQPAPEQEIPDVLYRVRAGGKWLREVNNLSSYAGTIGTPITDVSVKVTRGQVRYRVHVFGGSWLPYVTGYDIADHEYGYAGDLKPIDAIEIYYYTPREVRDRIGAYLKAKYRVSPLNGAYYPYQLDDEQDRDQDGYAGVFGKKIDRLQLILAR